MIPIHKTTDVPLTPAEAFDLFVRRIDQWWPKDSHGSGPDAKIVVEGHVGGAIVEVARDGTETQWGRILAWDPDRFLSFTLSLIHI